LNTTIILYQSEREMYQMFKCIEFWLA